MTNNIYKTALQQKLRFESKRGLLTVEDLFTLPLNKGEVNLTNLAIDINSQLKQEEKVIPDFLSDFKTEKNSKLQLQLDILIDIISTRKEDILRKENDLIISQQKNMLKDLIARKKQEKLENLSIEELEKQLEKLN